VNDREDVEKNIQKMDCPPYFLGNIFSRVGSGNQNNHQIEADRSQSDKNRLIACVEWDENVREAERDQFVKQQRQAVNQSKNQRLQRNPAMEIETAQAQKIFPDSRQARNRSEKNGNIKKKKTNQGARPDNVPVPGNTNAFHVNKFYCLYQPRKK